MARLKLLLAVTLLLACGPVVAEPVTLISLAAGLAANAGWISGFAAFAVSIGASVIGVAANRRKQKKAQARARAEYNAGLTDRTVTVLSSEAPWQVAYGSPAPFAGAIVAIFSSGSRDEFKHIVYVFAAHESHAIDELYVDGEALGTRDASGWVIGGTFMEVVDVGTYQEVYFNESGQATIAGQVLSVQTIDSLPQAHSEYPGLSFANYVAPNPANNTTDFSGGPAGGRLVIHFTVRQYRSRVNAQIHLSPGGVDTADAFLMGAVPDKWTSAHKLSGFTYVVLTLDLNMARFQGGPPNLTAKGRWKKLYDPRTGLTSYSANPILARADFIRGEYGFGADLDQIESAMWTASANAADVAAYAASDQTAGTTVLYSCDGVFTTDQDRDTTLQQLEDTCAGTTHESGGVWRLLAGYWTAPVMTIGDADAHGPVDVVQAGFSSTDRFNSARGRYCDWRNLGVSSDFPPYANATYVAADAETSVLDLTLPFTNAAQRAVQLARVAVEKSRGGLTLTWPGHARMFTLQPGDRVTASYSEFGISAATFRVAGWAFDLAKPIGLELVEDVATFYDLADGTVADPAPNTGLPDPLARPSAPQSLQAFSGTEQLLVQADGTIITRVLVQWAQPDALTAAAGEVHLRWLNAATFTQQTAVVPGSETSHYLTGVQDGATYIIAARFVRSVGAVRVLGNESVLSHQVIGKTAPPSDIESFTLDGEVLRWPAVGDLDLQGYRIRFAYGNNPFWASAAPLHEGVITSSPYTMVARPSGILTFLIKAVDTSGNESLNAAVIVANLGDTGIDNILLSYPQAAEGWPTSNDFTLSMPGYHDYTPGQVRSVARASTATVFDALGVLQTVAADVPRFAYHPVTHAALGLLLEPARTNLLSHNQAMGAAPWTLANCTNVGTTTAPDGTSAAVILQNTVGVGSYLGRNTALANSTTYAVCFPVKRISGASVLALEVNTGTGFIVPLFNLSTGVATDPVGGDAEMEDIGGGWWLCKFVFTTAATGSPAFQVAYIGAYGSTPTLTQFAFWGAGIEQGDSVTSLILTGTTTATRAAETASIAGGLSGGEISGGIVQADETDFFFGDDDQPFFGPDTEDFYATTTYSQMTYEWSRAPETGGRIVLQHTIAASDYAIEYRRDSHHPFYEGADGDLFFEDDADPFFGTQGDWSAWPGEITLASPETITWRITTAGGPTQGQITEATVILDVPDVTEELEDVVIDAGGTRLPLTQTYRSIENLLLTVQTDGNGGVSARIEDKNAELGPLVTVRNAAGTAVAGLVDARIRGY